jgi:hypothetical protein
MSYARSNPLKYPSRDSRIALYCLIAILVITAFTIKGVHTSIIVGMATMVAVSLVSAVVDGRIIGDISSRLLLTRDQNVALQASLDQTRRERDQLAQDLKRAQARSKGIFRRKDVA